MFAAAFACSTIFHYEHLKYLYGKCEQGIFVLFTPLTGEHTDRLKRHLQRNNVNFAHISDFMQSNQSADVLFSVYWQPSFLLLGSEILHARVMYGYAKDQWNYANWNENYDVIFTYGPYATDKLKRFAPCIETGNPRAIINNLISDHSLNNVSQISSRIKLLYCPTYGNLSSIAEFDEIISDLVNYYSIAIKLHHLNDLNSHKNILRFHDKNVIDIYDESTNLFDLLPFFDLIISDHSGAIFDAMLLKKKILLIDSRSMKKKIDRELNWVDASLDIAIRRFIPHGASEDIAQMIPDVVHQPIRYSDEISKLFAGIGTDVAQTILDQTARKLQAFDRKNRQTELYERLMSFVHGDDRYIVICGAGNFGQSIFFKLRNETGRVAGFVDRDPQKSGTFIEQVPILSVDKLTKFTCERYKFIVATVEGSSSYTRLLNKAGFVLGQDFFCPF